MREENNGELAQLARASALQAEGQRFESVILHKRELTDEEEEDIGESTKAEKRFEAKKERSLTDWTYKRVREKRERVHRGCLGS